MAHSKTIFAVTFLCVFSNVCLADWPQFRGPQGNGTAKSAVKLPDSWDANKNIAWKLALPGQGWSQPITTGNLVFVTTATSDNAAKPKGFMTGVMDPRSRPGGKVDAPSTSFTWKIHAIDLISGKEKWQRTISSGVPKQPIHPSNSFATETPATNGSEVFAYFGATGKLVAFNLEGKELWRREFGTFPILEGFGTGSSLTTFENKVIVECYNEAKSFQAAIDVKSGSELWRNELTNGSSWATPVIWKNTQRTELISCGKGVVLSVEPDTGKELWRLGNIDTAFASSPTFAGDFLYLGASSPGSSSPFYVVKAGAKGDITLAKGSKSNDHVVWYKTGMGPGMSSVIEHNGLLYTAGTGILNCYDAKTGERLYRERLPKGASIAANPIHNDGKLYFLDENGTTFVVATGKQFKLLATNSLPKETYWSSPALAQDCLLIRGTDHLYCIRQTNQK